MQPSRLVVRGGLELDGFSPSWQQGQTAGEVVFNTGMTGYVESLSDPSYAGQILVFTYPLIGNYGVTSLDTWESDRVQVSAVVVSEVSLNYSHAGSEESLLDWLKRQNVPLITGVDTRMLTKYLRTKGTMIGAITYGNSKVNLPQKLPVSKVSIASPRTYNPKQHKTVILVDCGTKLNILRSLESYPIKIKRVPADYDYTREDYAGVVISNGPGDPLDYSKTVEIAKKALELGRPVFGICLGVQIIGLAAGAKTYKLPYGHRGHNQPCMDNGEHCYITSQNHGYAIDARSLPSSWEVTFRNLNDDSVEGIRHKTKPLFGVQFHPEACPGPTDTAWLFKSFVDLL